MNRKRIWALATVVVLVLVTGVAYGVTETVNGGDEEAAAPTTAATERSTTTTTEATTTTEPATTTTAAPATTVPPAGTVIKAGSSGPDVQRLQERLKELKLDPGPADGQFGTGTTYAVWAFQKMQGMSPDGVVGDAVWAALANPAPVAPLVPSGGGTRVEVDKGRQLLFLYVGGDLRLVTHVSTGSGKRYCADGGCGTARTPAGSFEFLWRYDGWRTSRLGKLYNPVYFTGSGIAVHGAQSVPTYPASHGCVRIPMHIAEYFPSLVAKGDPVYVLEGAGSPPPAGGEEPAPAEPETTTTTAPPPAPESTTTTAPPPPESTTTTTTPPDTTPTTTPTTTPPPG